MYKGQVLRRKAPVAHDLNKCSVSHKMRTYDWRQVADPARRDQRRSDAGIVVEREMRREGQRKCFAVRATFKPPPAFWPSNRKGDQSMREKIPRMPWPANAVEVGGAGDKLVPVAEQSARDERRIFKVISP